MNKIRKGDEIIVIAGRDKGKRGKVVLRRGYGLGAQAMAGGHFHAGTFTISWPTGEFGAMGLEGAARLSLKRQLEALPDDAARDAMVAEAVAVAYERGKAISMASYLELDTGRSGLLAQQGDQERDG